MNTKIFIFVGLLALAFADRRPSYSNNRPRFFSDESFESFESGEAKYNFNWAVNHAPSRNDFGHQEARDGEDTRGSYFVQLPDGRLQKVSYFVDGDDGYVADVTYEGKARFPDSDSSESFESRETRRYG
ncbi:pro-resilin-like isoform X2 [Palaemon carinicauda]|uniref:pro-resilin-like n=1 Tax=Palaemon carinicauda TaxID=392227 RepID=UPI0035B671AC